MSWHRSSRKYHKWLMLFVGLQFVIWSVSGAYMVIMDIHYIHGDSFVAEQKQDLNVQQVNYSFGELLTAYPKAKNIELGLLLNQAVYRFKLSNERVIISANNGQRLSLIDEEQARTLAKESYANKYVDITSVTLLTSNPPSELSARHLPVWRIDFDDFASPSFYIGANSGLLVTKRHSFWRVFDWMFAFHVMDYLEQEPDNTLLLIISLLALIGSAFGLVLTYNRLAPSQQKRKKVKVSRVGIS